MDLARLKLGCIMLSLDSLWRTEKGNHRAWAGVPGLASAWAGMDLARLKLGCIMLSLNSLWRTEKGNHRAWAGFPGLKLGCIMLSLDHCGGPKREITGLELVFQDLHLRGLPWIWLAWSWVVLCWVLIHYGGMDLARLELGWIMLIIVEDRKGKSQGLSWCSRTCICVGWHGFG